jgi:pyruvate/2-oxoglutarate/acetoin dehydrogenase E1 component
MQVFMIEQEPLRLISYADALNEATVIAMENDPNLLVMGLGVNDPKRIFGTTRGLFERFGANRVFDFPTSEACMMGFAVGAATRGIPSISVHQRSDFFLLAMDQLINSAAKWRFMFGGQHSVPLVIRLICGRGWGQGPTHSQNFHAWFAQVPGLRVLEPSTPSDAKGLLLAAIEDPNPVVFIEHRWLHESVGSVPIGYYTNQIGSAKVARVGSDLTIVTMSYGVPEAISAANQLAERGVQAEVIDLRSIRPLDEQSIIESLRKTGRLLVVEPGLPVCSVGSEVISRAVTHGSIRLKVPPKLIAPPNYSEPTSFGLTKQYHPRAQQILDIACSWFALDPINLPETSLPHDVPHELFRGPF